MNVFIMSETDTEAEVEFKLVHTPGWVLVLPELEEEVVHKKIKYGKSL